MLQLLKSYKKIVLVLIIPYLFLLFLVTIPTQNAVTAPGGLNQVDTLIEIEGYDFVDNFNTVYVYSYYPITHFQSLVLSADQTMHVYLMTERQKDTSQRDQYLQGQVSKEVSFTTALIQAYESAQLVDAQIHIDYHYEGLLVYYRPSRIEDLWIGDQVVAINHQNYSDYTHEDFLQLSSQSSMLLTVKRVIDDEVTYVTVLYVKDENDLSLQFYPKYVIDSAYPSYAFPGLDSIVGGPSGGLIQTLSIYVSLVNINLEDDRIAGTGTIEIDGSVGRIGGISQKMYTAIYNNIDIMFIPKSHENEIPVRDYPFIIVPVETLEEAVNWLNEYYD